MEGYEFYKQNVGFLFKNFDKFREIGEYFMVPIPFEVKYEMTLKKNQEPFYSVELVRNPITIGALFLAWEQYPELFKVEDGEKSGMIYSFNGSPMSSSNCWSAVDIETGNDFSGKNAPSFRARCACLDEAVKYGQSLFGDIRPKTMDELVEFVRK